MSPKTNKEQARTAAVAALTEAWEPPIIELAPSDPDLVGSSVPWRQALHEIRDHEATDPRAPASGDVDVWTVSFSDPPCVVTVLLDDDGTLCASGVQDEIDLM